MSVISFQVFCIEFYATHINRPSDQVYTLFRDSGLLSMLESDYDGLHGLGMEAMMQFCDRFLGRERW